MSELYFVVSSSEDGIDVQAMKSEQLKRAIKEEYWGSEMSFVDEVPETDKGCFLGTDEGAILIIKGEIVVPKPKTVVKEWEV